MDRGLIFHYALVFFFTVGALIFLLYFWSKKRLDLDEGPKYQMLKDENDE